jgi:hypothetical protein
MPGPGEPGSFSLADPDRVHEVLSKAGFRVIDVMPRADQIVISEEQLADFAATTFELVRFAGALEDADQQTCARALAAIEQGLRARLQDDGHVRMSRKVLLVTAKA